MIRAEHGHLRRPAYAFHLLAHRHQAHLIPVARGHGGGPSRKLGPAPLEAVVGVAKGAGREAALELVVVGIGGRDEHVRRPCLPKYYRLQGGEAAGVEVLDDFDQRRRVEAG